MATSLLSLLHDTFWLVAVEGTIDTERVSILPTTMLVEVLLMDTPVRAIEVSLTVTAQVAVIFPSSVVTEMMAFPSASPVITPFDDTEAMELSLLLQFTFLFVALWGATVAERVSVPPTRRLVDALFIVMPVTEMGETVIEQAAVFFPSAVVTVITAFPTDTAETTPLEDTLAIAGALLLHVTF
jgi:hypothetical protein